MNEDETITRGGSIGRKHKEEVIEKPINISRVTFPASDIHKACYGVARAGVGA